MKICTYHQRVFYIIYWNVCLLEEIMHNNIWTIINLGLLSHIPNEWNRSLDSEVACCGVCAFSLWNFTALAVLEIFISLFGAF